MVLRLCARQVMPGVRCLLSSGKVATGTQLADMLATVDQRSGKVSENAHHEYGDHHCRGGRFDLVARHVSFAD